MKPYSRHKARALALQAIYQWQFMTSSVSAIEAQYLAQLNPKKVDATYFIGLFRNTTENIAIIDEIMVKFLDRKITQLNQVECALLRLAINELKYQPDVPYKVVIDEALQLARKFGSVEGYKYVNAILDKVARELRVIEFSS